MADAIYTCPECNSREVSDRKTKFNVIGWTLVIIAVVGASILLPLLLLPVGFAFVGYAFFIPKSRVLMCKNCSNLFSKEEGNGAS